MTRGTQSKVDDTRVAKLWAQGLQDKEIAERLGVSKAAIWQSRKRQGLKAYGDRRPMFAVPA